MPPSVDEIRKAADAVPMWYHTLELAPGVVTRGWFDLRPIVDGLPWPDVKGKRCLDVGTADGFLAFELERRGAAEVVAIDLPRHEDWDFSVSEREGGTAFLRHVAGPRKGRGFEVAWNAYESKVKFEHLSVYDLDPARMGTFDVVVCGSLLIHLKDPVRALEAIRTVCGGQFMSSDQIDLRMTLLERRRPAAAILAGEITQWFVPNLAGHRRLVEGAGFKILRTTRPYSVRFGAAHPPVGQDMQSKAILAMQRLVCGAPGVPHSAVLCRPV